jgi:hypothetical protein
LPAAGAAGPTPPALLIPNEDLTPLPAAVAMPPELLTDHWQFEIATTVASADQPGSFGFVNLFGINDEQALVLQDIGTAFRLDLYAGASQQVGNIEWAVPMRIRFSVDVPGNTISAETLEGVVTYGPGWDSTTPTTATKALADWTWAGVTANFGGFAGLFIFLGSIENVSLA